MTKQQLCEAVLHFHNFVHEMSKDRDVSSSLLSCMAESVHARMKTERPTGACRTIPFCKSYLIIPFCKSYLTIPFWKLYSTISWLSNTQWVWLRTYRSVVGVHARMKTQAAKTKWSKDSCLHHLSILHVYHIIQHFSVHTVSFNTILQTISYNNFLHTENLPHSEKI